MDAHDSWIPAFAGMTGKTLRKVEEFLLGYLIVALLPLLILVCLGSFVEPAYPADSPAADGIGHTTVCKWKYDKACAYSLTYDDGLYDSLLKFEGLHRRYGLVGTIGLVSGWIVYQSTPDGYSMGTWEEFKALLDRGYFDVASHSLHHPHLPRLTAEQIDQEYSESIRQIEIGTGYPCSVLLYPHNDVNNTAKTLAARHFIGARTGGDNVGNPPDATDYCGISGTTVYSATRAGDLNKWLEQGIALGNWLVLTAHGCDGEGWESSPLRKFEKHYAFVNSKLDMIWNGTFPSVLKYLKERQSSQIEQETVTAGEIRLTLTDGLDNAVFDQPLTLKTRIPSWWPMAAVVQNSSRMVVTPVIRGGVPYIYYEAVPDRGPVTVVACASGGVH